ncbi:MAG: membrane dipeptidase [Acidobacteria bacterium]|nr:membrane dipeptidase [Acidobacteriota bacterium]
MRLTVHACVFASTLIAFFVLIGVVPALSDVEGPALSHVEGPALEQDTALLQKARELHRQSPLIDGHNDYPWELRTKADRDFAKLDMRTSLTQLHTDIARLRQGGVGGQFWSVYVPASMAGQDAVRATMEEIDTVHRMTQRYPDTFELALTADDVERIFKAGKIASLIGMEGGHSIDSSLAALRMFHRMGARYMTITHGSNTPWADSATDQPAHGGLTRFGEEVVREMNWLGMLVDLSHVSPETMEDALRVAAAPVIFSHSSARGVADHPRNVPDAILQKLPQNGGVVMVTFVGGFITPETGPYRKAEQEEQDRLRKANPGNEQAVKNGIEAWRKQHPEPTATLSQVADHIDHIRKVAGIDHIGIGSDFDGTTSLPKGLENVSTYPNLTAELLRRKYSDQDIKKILGLNVLRAMRGAEKVSARLRAERPASPALIEQMDKKN